MIAYQILMTLLVDKLLRWGFRVFLSYISEGGILIEKV